MVVVMNVLSTCDRTKVSIQSLWISHSPEEERSRDALLAHNSLVHIVQHCLDRSPREPR